MIWNVDEHPIIEDIEDVKMVAFANSFHSKNYRRNDRIRDQ